MNMFSQKHKKVGKGCQHECRHQGGCYRSRAFFDCENLLSYIAHACILAKFYTGANKDMPTSRDFSGQIHGGVAMNCSF